MSVGSNRLTGAANPLDVAIVDGTGAQITSFGGGSGGTSHTDQSTFTVGSAASTTPVAFFGNESSPGSNAVLEGQSGIARMTLDRKVLIRLVGATDANRADVTAGGLLKVDASGVTVPVSQGATAPSATTMQSAVTANANGTSLAVAGFATAILNITASVTMAGGTLINFEASVDDTTFVAVQAINVGTNTIATTTLAPGDWQVDTTGYKSLRARISAYSAGTITIKGYPIPIPANSKVGNVNVIGTVPVSQVSLPLPALASTSTKQSDGTQKTQVVDGSGNVIGATSNALDINIKSGNLTTLPVTNAGTFTVQVDKWGANAIVTGGVNGSISTGGPTAADGVLAANPLTIGARAANAPPSAVSTNGDVVNAQANLYGELIVRHSLRETKGNQTTSIASSTSETTIVTADATYKLDLYGLTLSNTSATGTKVTVKDSTAGTTRFVLWVPPNDTRGFMLPASDGHKQTAANNNWTVTCGTSIANLEISALFVQNL